MHKVVVFALLLSGCRTANVSKHMRLLAELDNNLKPNLVTRGLRRFLSITHAPASPLAYRAGTTLALTCEAFAAPAPSIRWFKNNQPVYQFNKESNEIFDTNVTSLGKLTSTLLVSRTDRRDEYTCVASSGNRTTRATTLVYSDGSTNLIERMRLVPLVPQILVSYKVFMDLIGSSVILPCYVKGHPRPKITWIDNRGEVVKNGPRIKVLRSGELVITPLMWSDMGEFTCEASNSYGTKQITTFLYPASVRSHSVFSASCVCVGRTAGGQQIPPSSAGLQWTAPLADIRHPRLWVSEAN